MRPGLTGLAQVSGRNFLPWEERFALDVRYTREISLSLDIKILAKTVGKVLRHTDIAVGQTEMYQIRPDAKRFQDLDVERSQEKAVITK